MCPQWVFSIAFSGIRNNESDVQNHWKGQSSGVKIVKSRLAVEVGFVVFLFLFFVVYECGVHVCVCIAHVCGTHKS